MVQREVADPAEYVELWLKDAGVHGRPDYARRYDAWLAWFDEQGIEAVGFGWLNLRRRSTGPRAGAAPGGVAVRGRAAARSARSPTGPGVRTSWRPPTTRRCSRSRLAVRVDVRQETVGEAGAADPETIVLRQQRGMRRARQADTVEAGLVGACDGDLTVGQILDALATLLDEDAAALRRDRTAAVRELVADGFLDPGVHGVARHAGATVSPRTRTEGA